MTEPTAGPGRKGNPLVLGIILAVVGLALLVSNLFQAGFGGWLAFAGPGVVFLAVYFFHTRHLGFLIPGAVLTALGVLLAVERVRLLPQAAPQSAGLFFLFLGLPFLFIWYVHTRNLAQKEDRLWPLYPGALLTTLAVVFLVLEVALNLHGSRWAVLVRLWPLLLLLVGLGYILKARGGKARPAAKPVESTPPTRGSD